MRKYFILISFPLLLFCGCAEKEIKNSAVIMGTIWDVTIVDKNEAKAKKATDEIFDEIRRIEKVMSLRKPDSELSVLNSKAGTGPVKVSDDILNVMKIAVELSKMSNGCFDVSIGPVVKLWGFAGGKERVPSEEEIKQAHSLVGYKLIKIDPEKKEISLLKKGMLVDLGGIAKGYALDSCRKILKKHNISNIMISAGGQIYITGHNPENKLWKVGLKHPREKDAILTILRETNKCIATSGDYERFFISKGKLYHHIFNPFNSKPVSDTMSATVMIDNSSYDLPSTLADGLSTAIFVMGSKEGMKLLNQVKNAEAIIVTETEKGSKITVSDGLKDKLKFMDELK